MKALAREGIAMMDTHLAHGEVKVDEQRGVQRLPVAAHGLERRVGGRHDLGRHQDSGVRAQKV